MADSTLKCNSTPAPEPVQSTEPTASGVLELKDGSYLFVGEDGTMRMTDRNGNPVIMKDGAVMELKDGTLIMMQAPVYGDISPLRVGSISIVNNKIKG